MLSAALGRKLIRLQCYEGLDVASAVYEWSSAAQMIAIRLAEAAGDTDREQLSSDIFAERFLIKRPLLQALEPDVAGAPVLLIDELDRADEAFEAYLLEILSDFQVTIPEFGTIKAPQPPIVIITSNRTREIHDALKRRCFYYWIDYPNAEREMEILRRKAPRVWPHGIRRKRSIRCSGRRGRYCGRPSSSRAAAGSWSGASSARGRARKRQPRGSHCRRPAHLADHRQPGLPADGRRADRTDRARNRSCAV